MSGIFRGLGKQRLASIISLMPYYIIQTSLSWFFGFYYKMGVIGIWISMMLGSMWTTIIYLLVFSYLDFNEIKHETKKRLEHDSFLVKESKYLDNEMTETKLDNN